MIKIPGVLVLLIGGFVLFLFLSEEDFSTDPRKDSRSGHGRLEPAASALEHRPGAPRRHDESGRNLAFRERTFEQDELRRIQTARAGDRLNLDFFSGARFLVEVGWRQEDSGGVRLAGKWNGVGEGDRFFFASTEAGGRLLLEIPSRNLAYEVEWSAGEAAVAREWLFSDVACAVPANSGASLGIPPPRDEPLRVASLEPIAPGEVPILNTRPGAPDVIYMDFDGETVSGTAWDYGNTIVAPPARLTASQIREVVARMQRDFEGFDVNITTQRSVHDATPMNSRTHCIVTSNTQAAPGAGGVAYVGSFSDGIYDDWKICWVFADTSAKDCAEAASHEVGHTLGLRHHGRVASGAEPAEGYYEGHGSGATGWAPLMGVGYYRQLTQWSRGEYFRANNASQNDLEVMTRPEMLSYAADTTGNSAATAQAVSGDRADGSIERTGDVDFFRVQLAAGNHTIHLLPAAHTNLDAELAVLNSSNATIALANPPDQTGASATFFLSANQTVHLRVAGVGKGDPLGTGYSNYGSLGAYSLTGFGNQQQPPSAPVGVATERISGTQIRVSWMPNPSATTYSIYRNGTLIGTTADHEFLDTSATPGTETSYSVIATNTFGSSPASESTVVVTPAADEFIMDGSTDFGGYLLDSPGMTIHAAVRGNRLYVSTWSPGDNGSGFGSDHFLLLSDSLLQSATTPAPWAKAGRLAIPANKPYLAGESGTTYAGWFNAPPSSTLAKSPLNSGALEGSIDLVAAFGSVPQNIYIASVAYGTNDGNGINSQAPGTKDDNDLGPSEFLRIPVDSIRDRALNGTFDILDPARSFRVKTISHDGQSRPVLAWDVQPGRRFFVYGAGNLATGPWTLLNPGGWNADPGQWEMIFTDAETPAGARRFYRVEW